MKGDWVYRPSEVDDVFNQGSYDPEPGGSFEHTLTGGPSNLISIVLYDSQNYFRAVSNQSVGGSRMGLPKAARAEGRQPTIMMVEGVISFSRVTWTTGNTDAWAIRLGEFEQDDDSAQVLIDTTYTMYDQSSDPDAPAVFANDAQQNWKTWWFSTSFNNNGGAFSPVTYQMRFFWKGRRKLHGGSHCCALLLEKPDTVSDVDVRFRPCLRTFVSDPNS